MKGLADSFFKDISNHTTYPQCFETRTKISWRREQTCLHSTAKAKAYTRECKYDKCKT